jgi:hypothetical protein
MVHWNIEDNPARHTTADLRNADGAGTGIALTVQGPVKVF